MEALTLLAAFTAIVGFFDDILDLFMSEPTIYFVAVALFGTLAGVARKVIPMRTR